jgi:hypothetical protein
MSSTFSPVPYLGTSADNGLPDPYTQQMLVVKSSGNRSTYVSSLQNWNGCGGTTIVSREERCEAEPTSFLER